MPYQNTDWVICGQKRCLHFEDENFSKLKSTNKHKGPGTKKAMNSDKCGDDGFDHAYCYSNYSSLYNNDRFFVVGNADVATLSEGGNELLTDSNRDKLKNSCPGGYTWVKFLANFNGNDGYYGMCKRNVRLDKNECCKTEGVNPNDCPTNYYYNSHECKIHIQNTCNDNNNWNGGSICDEICFKPEFRDQYATQLSNRCSRPENISGNLKCSKLYSQLFTSNKANRLTPAENMIFNNMINADLASCESSVNKIKTDATCKGFCSREDLQSDHRVRCDEMATKYCNSDEGKRDTTFCACLNKTDNLPFPFIPICDGPLCVGDGYKTLPLIQASTKCPPCSQKITIGGSTDVKNNTQNLQCNVYQTNLKGAQETKITGAVNMSNIDRNENIWTQGKIPGNLKYYVYNTISDYNSSNFLLSNSTLILNFKDYSVGEVNNNFTMVFIGYIKPTTTDEYYISTITGGGSELLVTINDQIVANVTNNSPGVPSKISLSNSVWSKIKIVYKFTTGNQLFTIGWSSNSLPYEIISAKNLASGDGNWTSNGNSTTTTSTANSSTSPSYYTTYVSNYQTLSDDDKSNLHIWIGVLAFILAFVIYKYSKTTEGKEVEERFRNNYQNTKSNFKKRFKRRN